jgi:hypothetical protein
MNQRAHKRRAYSVKQHCEEFKGSYERGYTDKRCKSYEIGCYTCDMWRFFDDADVCTIRYIPNQPLGFGYEVLPNGPDDLGLIHYKFDTLNKAKAYATAYFVNKRLEESL